MRVRTVIGIVALLLPTALDAQRLPRPGTKRTPAQPADLPPAPGPIELIQAYKRAKLTVETYPLISRVQSANFPTSEGLISAWTTLGAGTRFDYRFTRFVSGTLDVTASALGGPADFTTAELGTRLHRERTESRFYPFMDFRLGLMASTTRMSTLTLPDASGGTSYSRSPSDRYSTGFGAVAGIGTEYALWRSWSLTTGGSVLRSHMRVGGIQASQSPARSFGMTWWRYSVGLSYNQLRPVKIPGSDTR